MTAPRIDMAVIHHDRVSWSDADRTDWRHVVLTQPGKLVVLLHLDNGKARLELAVFDAMGEELQRGRIWGTGGLRAAVAIEEPGPYFIRVRSARRGDSSAYSIRTSFEPQSCGQADVVCRAGDRICIGESSYMACERGQWSGARPCDGSGRCSGGTCTAALETCAESSQRCVDATHYSVCTSQPGAPPTWGGSRSCANGRRCRDGRCVRRVVSGAASAPSSPARPHCPRCQIIAIYKFRGVWTLHLDCPSTPRPGQTGTVVEENTGGPLRGGEVKVVRTSSHFGIATTSLDRLGKNKWVQLDCS